MRIGTWNLEGRWTVAHADLLTGLDCDVLLLTEVPVGVVLPGHDVHRSPVLAAGTSWAAVASRWPMTARPAPHPATVVTGIGRWTVACSVLPWRGCDPDPWGEGGTAARTVRAVDAVTEQLHGHDVIWGGDWNHALVGPEHAGSAAGRAHLLAGLADLGLAAPTRELPHRIEGIGSIDHIAVPHGQASSAHRVDATGLSDHDAYVVVLSDADGPAPPRRDRAVERSAAQLQPEVLPHPSHT